MKLINFNNNFRCQNETFDGNVESRIASLAAQLIVQHHDCLKHQLITVIE